jgi:hypothetical protein
MATLSDEISEIQRRMAGIRHEMHQEVQEAVRGAQSLTDWRSVVRTFPYLTMGVAAAAGFMLAPSRGRKMPTIVPVEPVGDGFANAAAGSEPRARRGKWSTLGIVLSLIAPVAVRAAQNYALHRFETWLGDHPLRPSEGGRCRSSEGGPSEQAFPSASPVRFRDSHEKLPMHP